MEDCKEWRIRSEDCITKTQVRKVSWSAMFMVSMLQRIELEYEVHVWF